MRDQERYLQHLDHIVAVNEVDDSTLQHLLPWIQEEEEEEEAEDAGTRTVSRGALNIIISSIIDALLERFL